MFFYTKLNGRKLGFKTPLKLKTHRNIINQVTVCNMNLVYKR